MLYPQSSSDALDLLATMGLLLYTWLKDEKSRRAADELLYIATKADRTSKFPLVPRLP